METVTLSNKKYVIVEQKKFEQLQSLAAKKLPLQKKLSLEEGKSLAYKLIDKWAKQQGK